MCIGLAVRIRGYPEMLIVQLSCLIFFHHSSWLCSTFPAYNVRFELDCLPWDRCHCPLIFFVDPLKGSQSYPASFDHHAFLPASVIAYQVSLYKDGSMMNNKKVWFRQFRTDQRQKVMISTIHAPLSWNCGYTHYSKLHIFLEVFWPSWYEILKFHIIEVWTVRL